MRDKFLKVAKQAALKAGEIISQYSGNFGKKSFKEGDKSNFATKADIEAERIIIKILAKNFPDHNVIAEEKGSINRGSKYTWAIDPLDGTFSFTKGIPQFTVSIGLMQDNKPVLGVIYHISTNELFWAQKGKGVFMNGQPIAVSKISTLAESALYLDFGHISNRQSKFNSYIKPLMNKVGGFYALGSAALGLAWVGKGVLEGNVNEAFIWDFVAGAVIVKEAGGRVTDLEGQEPDWAKQRLVIIASNGLIHDAVLEAIKR